MPDFVPVDGDPFADAGDDLSGSFAPVPKAGQTIAPTDVRSQASGVPAASFVGSAVGNELGLNDAYKALSGQMTPEEAQLFALGAVPMAVAPEVRGIGKVAETLTPEISEGGLRATELMSGLRDRLSAAGYHTYSPPNPNSLSNYLSVGTKSPFHEGTDINAVRIRASDHPGYDADFDFRPVSGPYYSVDLDKTTAAIIEELQKRGIDPQGAIAAPSAYQLIPVDHDPFADQQMAKGGAVKATKTQANYRAGTTRQHCAICTMFRSPGSCTAVKGFIARRAVCDYFERRKDIKPVINRKYDVPYLAGSSNDDSTVYIDRRVPRRIKVKRRNGGYVMVDPAQFLAAHEQHEHEAMRKGKSYAKAHAENGTPAERALVEHRGLDWKNYEEVMDGLLAHIEHEKPKRAPPDLYVKPYPHDKALLLKKLAQ